MERKLASVQRIVDIQPIANADNLLVATVLGWKTVIQKDTFKVGDLCIFVEVDSILPRAEWNEFLFKKDDTKQEFRLRTVRLRGQVSQGIVFPVTILGSDIEVAVLQEGVDVTDYLKIKKYEPFIPAQLRGLVKSTFPCFLSKTDETRIQTVPQVLERHKGKKFYVTEKLDGTSVTYYLYKGEFGVCSRNFELLESAENTYWKMARELDIENKLRHIGGNIAIQGELYGQGIQNNKYKLNEIRLAVFNVIDIDKHRYLDFTEFIEFCLYNKLTPVPVILSDFVLKHSIDDLVEYSKGLSRNSLIQREGVVFRPLVEEQDEDLGRLSFKVINPEYLLEHKE